VYTYIFVVFFVVVPVYVSVCVCVCMYVCMYVRGYSLIWQMQRCDIPMHVVLVCMYVCMHVCELLDLADAKVRYVRYTHECGFGCVSVYVCMYAYMCIA
jgi:hypothetical protein